MNAHKNFQYLKVFFSEQAYFFEWIRIFQIFLQKNKTTVLAPIEGALYRREDEPARPNGVPTTTVLAPIEGALYRREDEPARLT